MRVMVFFKANDGTEAGLDPTPEALATFAAMDRFTDELVAAGVFVAAAGLRPSSAGKRVRFDGDRRTVIDGPFVPARDLVAGFAIWEVRDMDEALDWARRCPNSGSGAAEIEIRPFFEAADLADFIPADEAAAPPRAGDRGRLGVA